MSLDAPLNDLEQHFVRAHLGRCGACAAFQEDARAFTTLLREAPLEPVPWPVSVNARGPRVRVQFRTIAQIASVASVVIAAGTFALAQEFPGTPTETSAVGASPSTGLTVLEPSIRSLRREALVRPDFPILASVDEPSTVGESGDDPSVAVIKPPLPVDGS